jgi:hypothetical protein
MPGLKDKQKNLKWHLQKLKISEAWDQFSWKRITQIISLHCLCNPFHRLSFWHGSTSWKFYTVQQTMELWTFKSIKQWAQVWYKASKSMGMKTNHFAQFLSYDYLIHNIVPWSIALWLWVKTIRQKKCSCSTKKNLQLLKRWELGHGGQKCSRKIVAWHNDLYLNPPMLLGSNSPNWLSFWFLAIPTKKYK